MARRSFLAAGFGALSHGKLILLLTLTTALLGVCAAMPLAPALSESLGGTLAGDHLIRNHPTFAPTDVFDFLREDRFAIAGMRRAALAAGILGVLLQAFFAGGIIAVLGRGPFSFGQFFEPARRNLWHNAKCLALFAISAGILFGLWFAGEGAATKKLFENVPPDAAVRSTTGWGSLVVEVMLFGALSLLYDFARAARRYSPTIGAFRAYRFSLRALSGSWLPAIGLFLFWLILGAAAVLALFAAAWMMPAVSGPAILALFLIQFGALWLRAAVRVAAWGSYIAFLEPRARQALTSMAMARYPAAGAAGLSSSAL